MYDVVFCWAPSGEFSALRGRNVRGAWESEVRGFTAGGRGPERAVWGRNDPGNSPPPPGNSPS